MSKDIKMTKVLLTGSTGFIGSALKARERFKDALTLTDFAKEESSERHNFNLESCVDYSDILTGVDVVIHLAGLAHDVKRGNHGDTEKYRLINTVGTLRLAQQSADSGVRRFIFLSTSKVFGENSHDRNPFTHTDTLSPQDVYAKSKVDAEIGVKSICEESGMEFVIIRPPLVYGPRVKGNFGSLISSCKRRSILPIGLLKAKRSYVAVDNLNDLIEVCVSHSKARNEVFLVSDDIDKSIAEVARSVSKAGRYKPKIVNFPISILRIVLKLIGKESLYNKIGLDMRLDISHTKKSLNWTPKHTMEIALERYL